MGFTLDVSISAVTVFLQGLLSFFSPCVLPLLPLYIGYLSGGTAVKGEDGKIHYKQSKVLVHTLFFVAGVSFAFFLLGLGVSAVGGFFHSHQAMFARVAGFPLIRLACISWGYLEHPRFWEGSTVFRFSWTALPCLRLLPCSWALPSALPGRPVWDRLLQASF